MARTLALMTDAAASVSRCKKSFPCFRMETAFQILKDVRNKSEAGFKDNAEKALVGAVRTA